MKKSFKLIFTLCALSILMVGCNSGDGTEKTEGAANEMQYIEKEEMKEAISTEEYVIIDARKTEDYNTSHLKGAYNADQDAANKGGDDEAGIANLKTTLKDATGSEVGNDDDKYALICYTGNSYAQKATDLMIEMGIDKEQIYTLKGGMKDWEAGGDEYKELLE